MWSGPVRIERPPDVGAGNLLGQSGLQAASLIPGATDPRSPAACAPGSLSGVSLTAGPRALMLPNGLAAAPQAAPLAVKEMIAAGNQIAGKPYLYGAAHGLPLSAIAPAYDCSSSVEHLLYGARLLPVGYDAASGELETFGQPGPGRWVTIYANADHVFMYVAGLRWDTHDAAGAGRRQRRDRLASARAQRGRVRTRGIRWGCDRASADLPRSPRPCSRVACLGGPPAVPRGSRVAQSSAVRVPAAAGARRRPRRGARIPVASRRRRRARPAARRARRGGREVRHRLHQLERAAPSPPTCATLAVRERRPGALRDAARGCADGAGLRVAAGRDRQQRHGRGDRAAVGRRDQYVVVTRELTTATNTTAYQGCCPPGTWRSRLSCDWRPAAGSSAAGSRRISGPVH